MAVFDFNRLFRSKPSQAHDDNDACRDVARAWCSLIADAADLHERLAGPPDRRRGAGLQAKDRSRS